MMCQIHLIEPKPRKDEVKKENVLCEAHHLLEVNNGIILNLNHETFSRNNFDTSWGLDLINSNDEISSAKCCQSDWLALDDIYQIDLVFVEKTVSVFALK